MEQNEDFLTRQIRAIGSGLAYTIGGKDKGGSQIIFPKKQSEQLPHQLDLQTLIDQHRFSEAAEQLSRLEFTIPGEKYFNLCLWFFSTLNQFTDDELRRGDYSKIQIYDHLSKLKEQIK
ncbi:DUF6483 family protein [Lentilactobacillus otakiensis]|jgi:hypothetical protein|uniref:Uncharacterized protein n=1 Tax=Lentilactobacillus otakiensis DSM 19908 = JCM 15040 TaxID=1423780 RepID=S4NTI0_9LACO|nr:DUF6483 family protein [Lentilactobacillus otakiensis]KRL10947.1 hypothetical protein FD05_GL000100 [Lentilactobacillus otakiensis DSM 19908 = JCM 15040]MBZ3777180.1 DUF6483 family protein [Lentilactobacillus otakiensis]MDV3517777.1 DUF6483 family protein [Lentilactobacillus otakiensis]GAD17288.1 hypothetical protein LOT_1826 [Lentilactobacillus otakiensis DSM 19908 = JCM 15040]